MATPNAEISPSAPPAYDENSSYIEYHIPPLKTDTFKYFPDAHLFENAKKSDRNTIMRIDKEFKGDTSKPSDNCHCSDIDVTTKLTLPAIIHWNGTLIWKKKGKTHRTDVDENGWLLPAIIYPNGGVEYYIDGEYCSFYNGKIFPAVKIPKYINRINYEEYYLNKCYHSFEKNRGGNDQTVIFPSVSFTYKDVFCFMYHKEGKKHSVTINGEIQPSCNFYVHDSKLKFFDFYHKDGVFCSIRNKNGDMLPANYDPEKKSREWWIGGFCSSWYDLYDQLRPAWIDDGWENKQDVKIAEENVCETHPSAGYQGGYILDPYRIDNRGVKYVVINGVHAQIDGTTYYLSAIQSAQAYIKNPMVHDKNWCVTALNQFKHTTQLADNTFKYFFNPRFSPAFRCNTVFTLTGENYYDGWYDTFLPDGTKQWHDENGNLYKECKPNGNIRRWRILSSDKIFPKTYERSLLYVKTHDIITYYHIYANKNLVTTYTLNSTYKFETKCGDTYSNFYINVKNKMIHMPAKCSCTEFKFFNGKELKNSMFQQLEDTHVLYTRMGDYFTQLIQY